MTDNNRDPQDPGHAAQQSSRFLVLTEPGKTSQIDAVHTAQQSSAFLVLTQPAKALQINDTVLRRQNDELRAENKTLQTDNSALRREVDELQAENRALKQKDTFSNQTRLETRKRLQDQNLEYLNETKTILARSVIPANTKEGLQLGEVIQFHKKQLEDHIEFHQHIEIHKKQLEHHIEFHQHIEMLGSENQRLAALLESVGVRLDMAFECLYVPTAGLTENEVPACKDIQRSTELVAATIAAALVRNGKLVGMQPDGSVDEAVVDRAIHQAKELTINADMSRNNAEVPASFVEIMRTLLKDGKVKDRETDTSQSGSSITARIGKNENDNPGTKQGLGCSYGNDIREDSAVENEMLQDKTETVCSQKTERRRNRTQSTYLSGPGESSPLGTSSISRLTVCEYEHDKENIQGNTSGSEAPHSQASLSTHPTSTLLTGAQNIRLPPWRAGEDNFGSARSFTNISGTREMNYDACEHENNQQSIKANKGKENALKTIQTAAGEPEPATTQSINGPSRRHGMIILLETKDKKKAKKSKASSGVTSALLPPPPPIMVSTDEVGRPARSSPCNSSAIAAGEQRRSRSRSKDKRSIDFDGGRLTIEEQGTYLETGEIPEVLLCDPNRPGSTPSPTVLHYANIGRPKPDSSSNSLSNAGPSTTPPAAPLGKDISGERSG
jgi:hypothetical protein